MNHAITHSERMIAESRAFAEAPTTIVGITCYDSDRWTVDVITIVACAMVGPGERLDTFTTRADAESFIARTFGDSFAHACHDGADAHDGYWLA
jgi:hypothetical protein